MIRNRQTYFHISFIKIMLNCMIIACSWVFLINDVSATKNKEHYALFEENFSKDADINIKGLYKHIHYTFENENLLREALHPLLPTRLQSPKLKYEHLEFIGDAVLGLVIRERILSLFPAQKRELHHKLYSSLTQNKTLAEVYHNNLGIEPYLPYPGHRTCEYCNVVEAIIGAIFNDNQVNGLNNSRKFIMRILDDHVLEQKWQEILEYQKTMPYENKEEIGKLLAKGYPVLPRIKAFIEDLAAKQSLEEDNPKSMLNMILTSIWDDRPEYSSPFLGVDEKEFPVFIVTVTGAQIGRNITGFGYTADTAAQDAAQKAINFLAQKKVLSRKIVDLPVPNFTKFVNEYCLVKQNILTSKQVLLRPPSFLFAFQVYVAEELIGQGAGLTKIKAREKAAQEACQNLIAKNKLESKFLDLKKQHRSILQEWCAQKNILDLKFIEEEGQIIPAEYKISIMVDADIMGQGTGFSIEEARENAYRAVFEQLLGKQQKELERQEKLKVSAKPTKFTKPIVISHISEAKGVGAEKVVPTPSHVVANKKIHKKPKSPKKEVLSPPSLSLPKAKPSQEKNVRKESETTTMIQRTKKQNPSSAKASSKQQSD